MDCLLCGEWNLPPKHLKASYGSCTNCGAILVARVYRIAPNVEVDRSLMDLTMLCVEFNEADVEGVKKIFRSAYLNLLRTRYNEGVYSVVALHIYRLQNDKVSNLNAYCKYLGVRKNSARRVLGRLSEVFKVESIYTPEEVEKLLQNIELKVEYDEIKSLIELVAKKAHISIGILSACIYSATNLSLGKIARVFHISRQTVLNHYNKLEEII